MRRFPPAVAAQLAAPIGALLVALVVAGCNLGQAPATGAPATPKPTASPLVALTPIPSEPPASFGLASGRIVFARFESSLDHFLVYTAKPDGSDIRELLSGKHALPRWSPDFTHVAVTSSGQGTFASIIKSDGTGQHDLILPDKNLNLTCAAWSADGSLLLCEGWAATRGREGLYTVRAADAGNLTRLTSAPEGIHDIPGDYTPDGKNILFVRATYPPERLGQLWMCDADGKNAHKVTDTLMGYRASLSRDGRYVVGDNGGSLLIFDLQALGQEPLRIVIPGGVASEPSWSPDGSRIVFEYIKKGTTTPDIYMVARDGTGLTRITRDAKRDEFPSWGLPPP